MNLKYEPVRVYGWVVSAVALIGGIVSQVGTSWDQSTGWKGLGLAVAMVVGAELTRRQTRSRASLEDSGVNPSVGE